MANYKLGQVFLEGQVLQSGAIIKVGQYTFITLSLCNRILEE